MTVDSAKYRQMIHSESQPHADSDDPWICQIAPDNAWKRGQYKEATSDFAQLPNAYLTCKNEGLLWLDMMEQGLSPCSCLLVRNRILAE